ncbi:hypothetical protein BGZ52_007784, partial [Haplosporangium bisporale]
MIFNIYRILLAVLVIVVIVQAENEECIGVDGSCKFHDNDCCQGTKCINKYKAGLVCMK